MNDIELGEKLIAKTPLYPDGHRRLAVAYLAAGRIENASEHYASHGGQSYALSREPRCSAKA